MRASAALALAVLAFSLIACASPPDMMSGQGDNEDYVLPPRYIESPGFHQPIKEWRMEHGRKVDALFSARDCMICHAPQTFCNACHAFAGRPLTEAQSPMPSNEFGVNALENSMTKNPSMHGGRCIQCHEGVQGGLVVPQAPDDIFLALESPCSSLTRIYREAYVDSMFIDATSIYLEKLKGKGKKVAELEKKLAEARKTIGEKAGGPIFSERDFISGRAPTLKAVREVYTQARRMDKSRAYLILAPLFIAIASCLGALFNRRRKILNTSGESR